MKIISPSFEILQCPQNVTQLLELCGRVCYKSEDLINDDSANKFVQRMFDSKHESVIEHCSVTVRIVCDRGVSHEICRHRICSLSQESTRYVNYSKGKFGSEITVIKPLFYEEGTIKYNKWLSSCMTAEATYMSLLQDGSTPQEARSVLPNSLKTEVVMTANIREWRHFFRLRTSKAAHPQMREIAIPMLNEFKQRIPVLFDDILIDESK
jgi:thymidylate synthase (FAD)